MIRSAGKTLLLGFVTVESSVSQINYMPFWCLAILASSETRDLAKSRFPRSTFYECHWRYRTVMEAICCYTNTYYYTNIY